MQELYILGGNSRIVPIGYRNNPVKIYKELDNNLVEFLLLLRYIQNLARNSYILLSFSLLRRSVRTKVKLS